MLVAPLLDLLFRGGGFFFVETRIAGEVERLGREGEACTGFGDDIHDAQQKVFADGVEFVRVASEDVGGDLETEGAAVEISEADAGAFTLNLGVGQQQAANFGQQIAQLIGSRFVADGEDGTELDFVAARKVFDIHGGEGAVGDGKLGAGVSADASGAEADVFDGAGAVAKAAIVADTNDFIGENGNSAEKIFEGLLSGEGDGDTADTDAGKDRGEIDANDSEDGESGDDDDQGREQALTEDHESAGANASGADGVDAEALHGDGGEAEKEPEKPDADEDADGAVVIHSRQQGQSEVGGHDAMREGTEG